MSGADGSHGAADSSASPPTTERPAQFTHVNERGQANMVDITVKQPTQRRALARCRVALAREALRALTDERDGNVILSEARVVGINAAKRTSSLIPLCHPILVQDVFVNFNVDDGGVEIEAVAEAFERTGLEMEALSACAMAALSIVGALRTFEPKASIESLTLWEKTGGRSGHWQRPPDETTVEGT